MEMWSRLRVSVMLGASIIYRPLREAGAFRNSGSGRRIAVSELESTNSCSDLSHLYNVK